MLLAKGHPSLTLLLASLLWLMQSLAIWHDAVHPFHLENDTAHSSHLAHDDHLELGYSDYSLCQHLEAQSNLPTLLPNTHISSHFSTCTISNTLRINTAFWYSQLTYADAIRAPPHTL